MPDFMKIHPADNVAVALRTIPAGTACGDVIAAEEIPQGHKLALTLIRSGEMVVKYGFPIGYATRDIQTGQWVP